MGQLGGSPVSRTQIDGTATLECCQHHGGGKMYMENHILGLKVSTEKCLVLFLLTPHLAERVAWPYLTQEGEEVKSLLAPGKAVFGGKRYPANLYILVPKRMRTHFSLS